jgi:hypothetical protein
MAKKIIGVYSKNISFTENKFANLYLTIDNNNLFFSVKNYKSNQFIAFEHFANNAEIMGWDQLFEFVQKNSKLIHLNFTAIFLVWNHSRFILTNEFAKKDNLNYQMELNLVHGINNNDEVNTNSINDNLIIAYTIPDKLVTLMLKIFPKGVWHHYSEFVLKEKSENVAIIYLFENQYCLNIKQNGQTKLINYFQVEGNDQNVYKIMNACEHSLVDSNLLALKVFGYQLEKHEFVNLLANYFNAGEVVESSDYWDLEDKENCPNSIYSNYLIF